MANEEPKTYTFDEYWKNYDEGHRAGRQSVWDEIKEYSAGALGVVIGIYLFGSGIYTFFCLLGWLKG